MRGWTASTHGGRRFRQGAEASRAFRAQAVADLVLSHGQGGKEDMFQQELAERVPAYAIRSIVMAVEMCIRDRLCPVPQPERLSEHHVRLRHHLFLRQGRAADAAAGVPGAGHLRVPGLSLIHIFPRAHGGMAAAEAGLERQGAPGPESG